MEAAANSRAAETRWSGLIKPGIVRWGDENTNILQSTDSTSSITQSEPHGDPDSGEPDYLDLASFYEVFRTGLGRDGVGFSFHIHGQEFTSFLRRTKAHTKALRDFQLRPRETFLYTCGGLDLWEWDFRILASEAGKKDDEVPVCLAGWGVSPPEFCGGPTGYRLMLKRQQEGESMGTPAQVEAVIAILTAAHADQPAGSWNILREAVDDGLRSIDQRLEEYGPLEPNRFSLKEANQRLAKLVERGRYRA